MYRILILTLVLCACNSPEVEIEDLRSDENSSTDEDVTQQDTATLITNDSVNVNHVSRFTYQIFSTENGWGYQIYENGTMRINQKHIPAMPGVQGFKTSDKARSTAEYIIQEMENGTPLPVLSEHILDSLDAL